MRNFGREFRPLLSCALLLESFSDAAYVVPSLPVGGDGDSCVLGLLSLLSTRCAKLSQAMRRPRHASVATSIPELVAEGFLSQRPSTRADDECEVAAGTGRECPSQRRQDRQRHLNRVAALLHLYGADVVVNMLAAIADGITRTCAQERANAGSATGITASPGLTLPGTYARPRAREIITVFARLFTVSSPLVRDGRKCHATRISR